MRIGFCAGTAPAGPGTVVPGGSRLRLVKAGGEQPGRDGTDEGPPTADPSRRCNCRRMGLRGKDPLQAWLGARRTPDCPRAGAGGVVGENAGLR